MYTHIYVLHFIYVYTHLYVYARLHFTYTYIFSHVNAHTHTHTRILTRLVERKKTEMYHGCTSHFYLVKDYNNICPSTHVYMYINIYILLRKDVYKDISYLFNPETTSFVLVGSVSNDLV